VGRGYAVASVGYRLSGDAPFPAQIEDVRAAVRWLRANAARYNLDPDRVGTWGSSAGGHLVALLGTDGGEKASRVQAVCDFFGPTDLVQMARTPGYERHASADSPESKLIGGPVLENRDKAARANPIAFVDRADPPFLIVHGDRDPVVPPGQSRLLFDALKKAAVPVRLHTLRGAGHGGVGFSAPETTEMVAAFFDRTLKGRPGPAGTTEARLTESDAAPTGGGAAAGTQPRPPARPPWDAVLARRDADRDGRLSRAEFPGPAPLFARLDRDGDGFLTRAEFEAAPPLPRPGRGGLE
jgi:acetyl esterase/lipase